MSDMILIDSPIEANWRDLMIKSDSLNKPTLSDGTIDCPITISEINELCGVLFREQGTAKNDQVRCYSGAVEMPNASETYLAAMSQCDLSLTGLEAVLGQNFGLVINGIVRSSTAIRDRLSAFIAPLMGAGGSKVVSYDLTLFVGDYGYTPFGVHLDSPTHRTLLYNLGPGGKEMHLWRTRDITNQFGRGVLNIFNPDEVEGKRDVYTLCADKPFLLPPHIYHVGFTKGLSVTAAIILIFEDLAYSLKAEMPPFLRTIGADCDPRSFNIEDVLSSRKIRLYSNRGLTSSMKPAAGFAQRLSSRTRFKRSTAIVRNQSVGGMSIMYSNGMSHRLSHPSSAELLLKHLDGCEDPAGVEIWSCLPQDPALARLALKDVRFLLKSGALIVSEER